MNPPMTVWNGCYDRDLKGVITKKAFAHPARFARNLIERIYIHMLDKGWIKRGDRVGDPFGGVATGGVVAAYKGLNWIGVELEPHYHKLGLDNIKLHEYRLNLLGLNIPILLRGDSRRFNEIVGELDATITSPPYSNIAPEKNGPGINMDKQYQTYRASGGGMSLEKFKEQQQRHSHGYGKTEGQIGRLKEGSVDSVVTSPPYSDISAGAGGLNHKPAKHAGQQSGRAAGASQTGDQKYGNSEGQISQLKVGAVDSVITSPPYNTAMSQTHNGSRGGKRGTTQIEPGAFAKYGNEPGQIEGLKDGSVEAVVSSPPYSANTKHDYKMSEDGKTRARDVKRGFKQGHGCFRGSEGYGNTPGQIGREAPETYWQAVHDVYLSCFKAMKPGGVICLVVKDCVKDKKRVRLCDDTCKLLDRIGFVELERIRAMQVEETVHADLFVGQTKTKREKKGFFRRLLEGKMPEGDERIIDWEEILFYRKP
jgi:DNA modification methylase